MLPHIKFFGFIFTSKAIIPRYRTQTCGATGDACGVPSQINRTTYIVSAMRLNLKGDKVPGLSLSSKASHSLNGVNTGFMAHCLGKEVT